MPHETHSQFGVGLADFEDKGLAIRLGVLAHDRLFPAHPGLRKKDRQHCARRVVLDRLCAGWRRHPEDIRHHKAPHPGVQLGGAHRDFPWKMLFQRPLIQWLAGLRVHHQLANHRLRDAQTHQDLDVVALLWGRNEGFSPAATRLPRHCIGPFFLDPNNMPAIVLLNWGTVMAVSSAMRVRETASCGTMRALSPCLPSNWASMRAAN